MPLLLHDPSQDSRWKHPSQRKRLDQGVRSGAKISHIAFMKRFVFRISSVCRCRNLMPSSVLRPAIQATITRYYRPSAYDKKIWQSLVLLASVRSFQVHSRVLTGMSRWVPHRRNNFSSCIAGADKESPANALMLSYDNGGLNMP